MIDFDRNMSGFSAQSNRDRIITPNIPRKVRERLGAKPSAPSIPGRRDEGSFPGEGTGKRISQKSSEPPGWQKTRQAKNQRIGHALSVLQSEDQREKEKLLALRYSAQISLLQRALGDKEEFDNIDPRLKSIARLSRRGSRKMTDTEKEQLEENKQSVINEFGSQRGGTLIDIAIGVSSFNHRGLRKRITDRLTGNDVRYPLRLFESANQ